MAIARLIVGLILCLVSIGLAVAVVTVPLSEILWFSVGFSGVIGFVMVME